MSYPCPYANYPDNQNTLCKRPAGTLRGFKKHMTRNHGGWTAEQVAEVVAANPDAPSQEEKEQFFTDGETVHETQTVKLEGGRERTRTADQVDDKSGRKARKAAVRLSNALGGVKDYISQLLPVFTVQFLKAKMGIEGTLSEEGQKVVGEAWAAYFDLLGFDLENAEPVKIKMSGRKLMFLYPLMMIPLTLTVMTGLHRVEIPKKEQKPKPQPVAVMPTQDTTNGQTEQQS